MNTLKIKTIFNKAEARLALSLYLKVDISLIQIDDQTGSLYHSEKKIQVSERRLMLSGCPIYKAYKGEDGQYYVRSLNGF